MSGATAYIALGSNLGDRRALIESALHDLRQHPQIAVIAVSTIIETAPVGPPDQHRYLNAAAELRTSLSPRELLDVCLSIEAAHGRTRTIQQRWGPRLIDIDILLYGDELIDEPGLHIPHPHMAERLFVLEPLAEIAPQLVHPALRSTIQSLRDRLLRSTCGEYKPGHVCSKQ
jgi:2-amino-4-hydroxy-6-hydroxymethyldihydropteridine diphosphokinase